MKTSITWRFNVTTAGVSDEETRRETLDDHLDAVMDQLEALTDCHRQVHDPAVSANLATGEVEFELLVDGDGADALQLGQSVIRAAIHTAGGFTPNWDGEPDSAEPIEYAEPVVNLEPVPA